MTEEIKADSKIDTKGDNDTKGDTVTKVDTEVEETKADIETKDEAKEDLEAQDDAASASDAEDKAKAEEKAKADLKAEKEAEKARKKAEKEAEKKAKEAEKEAEKKAKEAEKAKKKAEKEAEKKAKEAEKQAKKAEKEAEKAKKKAEKEAEKQAKAKKQQEAKEAEAKAKETKEAEDVAEPVEAEEIKEVEEPNETEEDEAEAEVEKAEKEIKKKQTSSSPLRKLVLLFRRILANVVPTDLITSTFPGFSYKNLLAYLKIVKKTKHFNNYGGKYHVEGLAENQALWLVEAKDRRPEDPVIVYVHGGGYYLGAYHLYVQFLMAMYNKAKMDRLSIVLLDYSLTPKNKFPKQLVELDLLYQSLMKEGCTNLLLLGDSAGAHLAISYLKFLNLGDYEEDPDLQGLNQDTLDLLNGDNYPKGVIMISPWFSVNPDPTQETFTSNKTKDFTSIRLLKKYGGKILDKNPDATLLKIESKFMNHSIDDTTNWEKILPKDIYITVGDLEILKTDVLQWCELANLTEDKEYRIIPEQVHDGVIIFTEESKVLEEIEGKVSLTSFLKRFDVAPPPPPTPEPSKGDQPAPENADSIESAEDKSVEFTPAEKHAEAKKVEA